MDSKEITEYILNFLENSEYNYVPKIEALRPDLVGMKIYDGCLVGIADAGDHLFTNEFKKEGIIHPDHCTPRDFLPDAESVISFFLPFCENVYKSNYDKADVPFDESIKNQRCSSEWLHARIEGQKLIAVLSMELCKYFESKGFSAVSPLLSDKFKMLGPTVSNWSERHAAYAAGLGTFSLSKGLITKRGTAGRFGSIVTNAKIDATQREYKDPFEYCIMCGACQKNCPSGAIDKSKGVVLGKDKLICRAYVDGSRLVPWGENNTIRYGCGKCNVNVPCEHKIPGK